MIFFPLVFWDIFYDFRIEFLNYIFIKLKTLKGYFIFDFFLLIKSKNI